MSKNPTTQTKGQVVADPMSKRPDFLPTEDINIPVEESVRFPRLKLIQALSPEKTKGNEKYIPGLEEGNFIMQSETFTRNIDGEEGITVVPMAIRKRFVEYVPRTQGGGFVASYDTKEECDNHMTPGNDIQTTIEFLCIEPDVEEPTPFTITFDTVTKLGVARKWAGFIGQYKTLNGVKYQITAKMQQNKQKQSYYNFAVQPIGWLDKAQHVAIEAMTHETEQLFLPAGTNSEI